MTDKLGKPRIDYIDADISALSVWQAGAKKSLALIEADPEILRQTRFHSLASEYSCIALASYALGFPLEAVGESLHFAAEAYLEVLRLRGTEPPFEAYEVSSSTPENMELGGAPFVIRPMNAPKSRDYSITNSRDSYYAACKALIASSEAIAMKIAGMIWDPPNASYLGKNSVVCTLNEQRIAYAMREFCAGNLTDAEAELNGLSSASLPIAAQATMWRAIIRHDTEGFLRGLDSLVCWHEKEARMKKNRSDVEYFMCVPGLGLSCLAVRNGVCQFEQLPTGNPFLPIDLLSLK